jgi:hypothetical protein
MAGNGPDSANPTVQPCGDCFWAAYVHAIDGARADLGLPPSGLSATSLYSQGTGYDPTQIDANGNNPTDQGTDPVQGLNWLRENGYIDAWAEMDHPALLLSSFLLGKGLIAGVGCPDNIEDQFEAGGPFAFDSKFPSPREADHAVYLPGYNPRELVTWGGMRQCTPAWNAACIKQYFCIIAKGQLDARGLDEFGLNGAQLIADNEFLKDY